MNSEKKYIDKDKKYLAEPNISRGMKIYLAGCTLAAITIATFFINNPGITHPKREVQYESIILIKDLNNDQVPELQATYRDGSTAILYSHIKNQNINYRP